MAASWDGSVAFLCNQLFNGIDYELCSFRRWIFHSIHVAPQNGSCDPGFLQKNLHRNSVFAQSLNGLDHLPPGFHSRQFSLRNRLFFAAFLQFQNFRRQFDACSFQCLQHKWKVSAAAGGDDGCGSQVFRLTYGPGVVGACFSEGGKNLGCDPALKGLRRRQFA